MSHHNRFPKSNIYHSATHKTTRRAPVKEYLIIRNLSFSSSKKIEGCAGFYSTVTHKIYWLITPSTSILSLFVC